MQALPVLALWVVAQANMEVTRPLVDCVLNLQGQTLPLGYYLMANRHHNYQFTVPLDSKDLHRWILQLYCLGIETPSSQTTAKRLPVLEMTREMNSSNSLE